jgi:hypothetical protein
MTALRARAPKRDSGMKVESSLGAAVRSALRPRSAGRDWDQGDQQMSPAIFHLQSSDVGSELAVIWRGLRRMRRERRCPPPWSSPVAASTFLRQRNLNKQHQQSHRVQLEENSHESPSRGQRQRTAKNPDTLSGERTRGNRSQRGKSRR